MSRPTALVTGASAGIGYELARVFAEKGFDLVLTARREDRLTELAATLPSPCRVEIVPLDLARGKGPARLVEELEARSLQIDVLVNNAGVAASGPFQSLAGDDMRRLLNLNVRAVTELTHALLPAMLERRQGRVLNIASVAGFQGIPGMSLYSASKAFVLAFTEALSEDLRGTGVTVTALCPGLTRTDMVTTLEGLEHAGPFLATARDVALEGYRACMAGEVVRVPGLANQALVSWMKYQPRWLVRTLSGIAARTTFTKP